MGDKLWVPPPPQTESGKGRRSEKRRGKPKRGYRTSRDCLSTGLAMAIVALALLAGCLIVAIVPSLMVRMEDGRLNLLLLGIDRRGGTGWAYRTDTIIVVTADPQSGTGGMMSIPRDLQLPIPDHGQDRINTANVYGSMGGNPDGGPALLKSTIEASFGIPVDGYLMADFATFVKIVDSLGGIDVDVPRKLHDTRYPDPRPGDPHAYKTVHVDVGLQHMDGKQALEYARSRMSTSDFDRAKRQQLVLLAIRHKALSLRGVLRWPQLAGTVLDGIRTDLGPQDLLVIGIYAMRMNPSSVEQIVLEHPFVASHRRADGAAVQLPNWDLINPVINDLFGPRAVR